MGGRFQRGTFLDAHGFAAHVEKYRWRFFRRPMNWAMEKALLAAYTPPLRNKVRQPAGFPTPFGWAYPVLVGAGVKCGRNPSADWGRALPFPLPLTQSGSLRASRHLFGVGLPGLILCRGQVRPPSECRLGKGFALPLSPFPFPSQAACGLPDTLWGGLTWSWWVQELSAAAGRVQTGEGLCPSPCP